MSGGLRVIQVYLTCVDFIVHSELYDDNPIHAIRTPKITALCYDYHKEHCDRVGCALLHLRDVTGHFYSLNIP